ncbi:MAG: type VI secretion system ATPase TssH [Polyangiaceae bacterium]|nr:type VI secretion system ATPase TssH [Polyangiaceae bacterium]
MIPIELKPLLMRLNRAASRALEAAAGLCVSRSQYEVTVEHVLLKMLDAPDSDVAFIVLHFDIEAPRLARSIEQALTTQKTGNAGKPVLSPLLIEWIEDAWMVASIEQSENAIRTGSLLTALASRPHRYLTSDLPELEKLRADDLKRGFRDIVAGSPEEGQRALEAPGGGGAAGPRRADSALGKFANNLTAAARAGRIDPVFARDAEIRQAIDILLRRRKNNPIIVGEAGVGKTAIVEGLALRMAEGDVPDVLRGVDIYGLDLGLLQAGAGVRGEFEARLKAVIDEVKASAKSIILFIDEAHTLIGAGNAPGASDAANLLKPALARGELRTIAATTWSEYKKYFEKDAALERRFQPVKVDEPSEKVATIMLRGLRSKFEAAHNVIIQDEAVTAAVRLSARYISGRQLPDKAVDLLDTCSARVKVALQQKPAAVEDAEVLIENTQAELKALDRDRDKGVKVDPERVAELTAKLERAKVELEEVRAAYAKETEGTKKVIEARKKMDEAKTDEERDVARREVVAALDELTKSQGEVPLLRPDVDEAMVATVVAAWTGIPVGKMVQDDVKALLEMEDRLTRRIKGQHYGIMTIAKELRSARAGLKPLNTPQGVFLLVGPSGVGKTETGLGIADLMFGGERMMTVINMSEFQEKHTVSRLIGSPPGYVGYGEGGMLTEAVRQRPYTVVLLDEVEKADPDVMNLFYQVFDKGMLSDGEGRLVDFKNTVIILTSNLGTDKITNMALAAREDDPKRRLDADVGFMTEVIDAVKPTLVAHFKPALLARMTTIPYLPISPEALGEITRLKMDALVDRLRKSQRVEATYTDALVEMIAKRCTEVDTGARNIDHILRATLLPQLSVAILERMAEGALPKRLQIGIDASNNFTIDFSS